MQGLFLSEEAMTQLTEQKMLSENISYNCSEIGIKSPSQKTPQTNKKPTEQRQQKTNKNPKPSPPQPTKQQLTLVTALIQTANATQLLCLEES